MLLYLIYVIMNSERVVPSSEEISTADTPIVNYLEEWVFQQQQVDIPGSAQFSSAKLALFLSLS